MNDRALRNIVIGMGGKTNGVPRESSFQITVASEIMAIFCLATSITDLKERIGKIVFGYDKGKMLRGVGSENRGSSYGITERWR